MPAPAPPKDWPLSLALAAALVPEDGVTRARALAEGMTPTDWERFGYFAIERHRIAPVIAPRLAELGMPEAVRATLEAEIRRNAADTLVAVAETRRLMDHYRGIGIEPVIFKGWPLAEALYGAASLRHSGDLDLLVPADRIAESCNALIDLGYECATPGPARICTSRALRDEGKDIRFFHAATRVRVELHWNLHPFHGWPDPLAIPDAVVSQESQAGVLACPAPTANMLYLSVHGTLHLWTRLKWLADIDRLARRRGIEGLEADLETARELGIVRAVALGLRLSARLFATPVPDALQVRDAALSWAERWMLDAMTRDDTIPVVTLRYRFWVRLMALILAANLPQLLGVLRYDTIRRARLRLAALTEPPWVPGMPGTGRS